MNKSELSNIQINRNGILCESVWFGRRVNLLDGWHMDSVFDDIEEWKIIDLLNQPEGSRYINFAKMKNSVR